MHYPPPNCEKPARLLAFDGPMLYVLARGEAVFPGLEWVADDKEWRNAEVSSGTLDIAQGHPHQVRYVVHPNMVTIPAVGICGEQGTVGLVWDVHQKWDGQRDRPSVVFASPDRFENQRSHLVGLFLPSVPEYVELNQREAAAPYPLEPDKPLRLTARIFADAGATVPGQVHVRASGRPTSPRSQIAHVISLTARCLEVSVSARITLISRRGVGRVSDRHAQELVESAPTRPSGRG
ncbi:MAG: hypothetical protein ACYTG0_14570 [Planctomycetota bacterium]|jgi:hypothetical protein